MENSQKIHIRKIDFKLFFNQMFPSLCVFANRFVKDEEVAKDVVQDVFTVIWNSSIEFKSKKSMRTYFYLSTKNKCFDYLKQARIKSTSVSVEDSNIAEALLFSDYEIVNEIIREETYRLLKECIEQLPPKAKEILLLNLKGFSNQEIADHFGVSINTIKTQKLKSYRKLRELFGDQYALWLLIDLYKNYLS
ncbi:RNA polymerase sigma-70 factor [Saccharicrinis fermentans]|uniref:RNA polymerase sigma factor n=1 Tax=Saccharicrinis fermentans DSM 9555 = JCM 21142 TaxID=869213 RepID=W7YGI8_9BACT|nr:RNA polymerase sigma-70 factor [Saccharicrinis fermentans]GAF03536.1 RNA polymerase sigma factor [Saccharicrinis fermentans DSM 9555 = JCM 21142]